MSRDRGKEFGRVSHINTERGFGFLKINGRSEDTEIFFHSNDVQNAEDIRVLRIGDEIECRIFDSRNHPGQKEAKEVYVLTDVAKRNPTRMRRSPPPRRDSARRRSPPPRRPDSYQAREPSYSDRPFRPSPNEPARYRLPPPNRERTPPRSYGHSREDLYDPQNAHLPNRQPYPRDFRDLYAQETQYPPPRRQPSPLPPRAAPSREFDDRHYDRPIARERRMDPYDRYEQRSPVSHRREYRERSPPPPRRSYRSPPRRERARGYERRDHKRSRDFSPRRRSRSPAFDREQIHAGTVVRIHERGYGFIRDQSDTDRFFPAKQVRDKEITDLKIGDKVTFKLGKDKRNGRVEAQEIRSEPAEEWLEGTIARIKQKFGFIETEKGSIYFHGRHVLDVGFEGVEVGNKVSFLAVPSRSRPGTLEGQQITVIE